MDLKNLLGDRKKKAMGITITIGPSEMSTEEMAAMDAEKQKEDAEKPEKIGLAPEMEAGSKAEMEAESGEDEDGKKIAEDDLSTLMMDPMEKRRVQKVMEEKKKPSSLSDKAKVEMLKSK